MRGWGWPFPTRWPEPVPAAICLAYFECDRPVMRTRGLRLWTAAEHRGQTGEAAG
jgi:hypothetical protein